MRPSQGLLSASVGCYTCFAQVLSQKFSSLLPLLMQSLRSDSPNLLGAVLSALLCVIQVRCAAYHMYTLIDFAVEPLKCGFKCFFIPRTHVLITCNEVFGQQEKLSSSLNKCFVFFETVFTDESDSFSSKSGDFSRSVIFFGINFRILLNPSVLNESIAVK